jgi:hypothetical protein
MMRKWRFLITPILGATVVLSGCNADNNKNDVRDNAANSRDKLDYHDKKINTKGNGNVHGYNSSVNVIPSIDRAKKRTTNEHNATTNGLGTNVYSLIGSSSLHDGGISSHLESRLSSAGIPGIKVFVLDDTVILARANPEVTSTKYDELQNKVLKNTSGASGKGTLDGVDYNKLKTNNHDNLESAKQLVNKSFGGQVQVLTVTSPRAMTLIDRIKGTLKSAKPSYSQLSSDINTLIQMTNEK